jgi:hypothetical protein
VIIITPHVKQISAEFDAAFRDWYRRTQGREVFVDWRGPFGTSEIVKLLQAQYVAAIKKGQILPDGSCAVGTIGYDIMFGGGSFDHGRLKDPRNAAAKIVVAGKERCVVRVQTLHPDAGAPHAPKRTRSGVSLGDFRIAGRRMPSVRFGNAIGVDCQLCSADSSRCFERTHQPQQLGLNQPKSGGHWRSIVHERSISQHRRCTGCITHDHLALGTRSPPKHRSQRITIAIRERHGRSVDSVEIPAYEAPLPRSARCCRSRRCRCRTAGFGTACLRRCSHNHSFGGRCCRWTGRRCGGGIGNRRRALGRLSYDVCGFSGSNQVEPRSRQTLDFGVGVQAICSSGQSRIFHSKHLHFARNP